MGKLRPWEGETPPKDTQQASDRGGLNSSSPGSPVRLFPAHLTKDGVKVMVGDEEGNSLREGRLLIKDSQRSKKRKERVPGLSDPPGVSSASGSQRQSLGRPQQGQEDRSRN